MKKAFLFLSLIALLSCEKEGTVGPQGPQGPAGPAGTSIIISTNTTQLNNWTFDATNSWYFKEIVLPDITQQVVEKGAVLVFAKYGTETNWWPVPDTNGDFMLNFTFYIGGIKLFWFKLDNSTPNDPGNSINARVVVVPPAVKIANPNTNWNNYKEVQALLQLKN